MKHIIIDFLLLGTVVTGCAKDIVDLTGSVKGIVKDYNSGFFISNCQVSLIPTGKSSTTTEFGAFEFTKLEPGEYSITYDKAGYEQQSEVITIVSGEIVEKSILLKSKSAFALSHSIFNFGDLQSSGILYIYNNTDSSCSYEIANIPTWMTLNHTSGTVYGGSQDAITMNINRELVTYGDYSQSLLFTFSGKSSGTQTLLVTFKKVKPSVPTVLTSYSANSITQSGFDISGEIVETGGAAITSFGHCWSLVQNPTIKDEKNDLGSTESVGPFLSHLTNLSPNTTYYVRAYATNEQGTAYSEQAIITTQGSESNSNIVVKTKDATNIKGSSVTLNGEIEVKGLIREYGFYYGTNTNPTLRVVVGTSSVSGDFAYDLDGLNETTKYYYKAYVKTLSGFTFGGIVPFTTGQKPGVDFSNYKYSLEYYAYDKNYYIHKLDFYTEFDTRGESVIEAGFVIGNSDRTHYTTTPTLTNGIALQCEVLNNNSIHYQIEEKVKSNPYLEYAYLRPYIIVESGTYYGVRGYATRSGTFYYPDE